MKTLSFMPQFEAKIRDGSKVITFRKNCFIMEGDYFNILINNKRVIGRGYAISLEPGLMTIKSIGNIIHYKWNYGNGQSIDIDIHFANQDGFDSVEEMLSLHARMGNIGYFSNSNKLPILFMMTFDVVELFDINTLF